MSKEIVGLFYCSIVGKTGEKLQLKSITNLQLIC